MKEEAKKKLIKDLMVFAISAGITLLLLIVAAIGDLGGFRAIAFEEGVMTGIIAIILVPIIMGFEIAGVVVGWKALSKRMKSHNLIGFIIKVCIAVFVGYVLFPIVIIKDICAYVKA